MRTYLDCISCFFRQALDMTRITGVDEATQKADENRPIFFLFKVKCPVIANHTGFNLGDIVLKKTSEKQGG